MNISVETLRLKLRNQIIIPLTRNRRKHGLRVNEFTILSNNCWAGTVYESYGMQKMTPTIGMFIMPADYLKLINRLEDYTRLPLVFIKPNDSKWRDALEHKNNWGTYLIGRLGDVELHMVHYHDEGAAKVKWESRVKRIRYDRLIFKFNDQNGCTPEQIHEFMALPLQYKICFVASEQMQMTPDVILIRQPHRYCDGIKASREPFGKSKYIDMTTYINRLGEGKT
jgi:uncharacterized protein (DUF1919 family)